MVLSVMAMTTVASSSSPSTLTRVAEMSGAPPVGSIEAGRQSPSAQNADGGLEISLDQCRYIGLDRSLWGFGVELLWITVETDEYQSDHREDSDNWQHPARQSALLFHGG